MGLSSVPIVSPRSICVLSIDMTQSEAAALITLFVCSSKFHHYISRISRILICDYLRWTFNIKCSEKIQGAESPLSSDGITSDTGQAYVSCKIVCREEVYSLKNLDKLSFTSKPGPMPYWSLITVSHSTDIGTYTHSNSDYIRGWSESTSPESVLLADLHLGRSCLETTAQFRYFVILLESIWESDHFASRCAWYVSQWRWHTRAHTYDTAINMSWPSDVLALLLTSILTLLDLVLDAIVSSDGKGSWRWSWLPVRSPFIILIYQILITFGISRWQYVDDVSAVIH